jgi:hypothetical protein
LHIVLGIPNFGDARTSAVSAIVLFALVAYVNITRKDVQRPDPERPGTGLRLETELEDQLA